MRSELLNLAQNYSVEFWFWNGFPDNLRPVTGYLFSRGADGDMAAAGDHWGISGTIQPGKPGRLFFFNGNAAGETVLGRTPLELKTWYHVVLVREGETILAYLNGNKEPELKGRARRTLPEKGAKLFIGGRCDNFANFEGKMAHVAVYDRVLTPTESVVHYTAAVGSIDAAPDRKGEVSAVKQPDGSRPLMDGKPPAASAVPLTPAEGLAAWQVSPGFRVELVAAEPLVMDPVAIDWGAEGKLWVAEMADYPLGIDGKGKPGGRIRYLEDTDGDHRYDKSTLFLDGVHFPNGVLAWGKGVLVTAAPEIFYAEDADGDGRAEIRRRLYTGFVEGNQQLRVNGLRLGLDNWIYCASGAHFGGYGEKSRIRIASTGESVSLGSRDFRIRPDQGLLDPQSGPAQFGRDRDDWGNWFGVQNSYPLWHYVLEDHYLRRNPLAAPPDPRRQLTEEANPKVYPVSRLQKRYHNFQQSGRFTSACSPTIYRDELLFPRHANQHSFTCEPVHNLVHHRVLRDDGVSFTSARPKEEAASEFLASTDPWCRPVMARTGPDGALWIVDMYRYMIEHPDFLPPEGQRELKPHYRAGADRGRIYRMVPEKQSARSIPRLAGATAAERVTILESPNGPLRDMAQRLLIAQADSSAIEPLTRLAADSKSPLAQLHALCTLDGLGKLKPEWIVAALASPHPGVRRQAVRLAESHPASAAVIEAAVKLTDDPDPKVRLQLACTLGAWDSPQAAAALARLAARCRDDRFMSAAVLSSIRRENIASVVESVFEQSRPPEPMVSRLCAMAIALKEPSVEVLLGSVTRPPKSGPFQTWQLVALAATLDALPEERQSQLPKSVSEMIAQGRETVIDAHAAEETRVAAAALLLRTPGERAADLKRATKLLAPQVPSSVQGAVVQRLAKQSEPEVVDFLLASWRTYSPSLRAQVLPAVASRPAWVRRLVTRLDDGTILAAELSAAARQQLLATRDAPLQSELEKRLGARSGDRQQALNRARAALELSADRTRGAALFEKKCAVCHQVGQVGRPIGPNLASVTNKTPAGVLEAMIDPSRGVDAKYLNYIAVLTDGRTFSGLLEVETGSSITLLTAEGQRQTILRSDLEDLRSSGKSLMPDGFEQDLASQDLADLIGYVLAIE
jgi:putative membrane-bound dehydrogenase-like protein